METISRLLMFFLLNSVWQITLIATVSLFCDWLLQKTSARFRHLVWVAALILSVGLPMLTSLNFYRNNYPIEQTNQSTNVQPSLMDDSVSLGFETSPQISNPVIAIGENLSIILLTLYFFLLSYRISKLFEAWKRTQNIRQNIFSRDHPPIIASVIEKCKSALRVKKARILYSSTITSPITLGYIRPIIILPEKLLQETDCNTLLSAIGHELTHVKRNDFFLNLLYEFVYLPVSFHPAATLMKRRIKETRELSCDESVTDKLLEPDLYARSLVQLAGSAMDLGRTTTMTIGISDADILEKRIMKILNKSKITANRRNLLLSSASFVFVLSVIVTLSFTLIPVVAQQSSTPENEAKRKAEAKAARDNGQNPVNKNSGDKQQQSDTELAAKQKAESEISSLSQSDLAKQTKITMAEAIEIATRNQPGTVLEAKMVFVKIKDANQAFYAIKIVFDQGTEKGEKLLLINGNDGKIEKPEYQK